MEHESLERPDASRRGVVYWNFVNNQTPSLGQQPWVSWFVAQGRTECTEDTSEPLVTVIILLSSIIKVMLQRRYFRRPWNHKSGMAFAKSLYICSIEGEKPGNQTSMPVVCREALIISLVGHVVEMKNLLGLCMKSYPQTGICRSCKS